MRKFTSTKDYVTTPDLELAVNSAITLEKPLLVKGEPGTGKTLLAEEISKALDTEIIKWHIKSTTKAQQGLYEYDAITRLRDSQLGDSRVKEISNYIVKGKLWEAFTAKEKVVLLIDEIDKADIEFPNDLLQELDRMEFYVYETKENNRFKVYEDYKLKLKAYSKKRFDPFCRWDRIKIPTHENSEYCFETTIGQLNFFKWAIENKVIQYIENNYQVIENDMNSRNSTSKNKDGIEKVDNSKTRKKREELSVSAVKCIKKD